MKGYIYKITNPNGWVYIGQTTRLLYRQNKYKNKQCKSQPAWVLTSLSNIIIRIFLKVKMHLLNIFPQKVLLYSYNHMAPYRLWLSNNKFITKDINLSVIKIKLFE